MEGKWLIADRDLNEREGLKWLLKTSSIPVANIFLASSYQGFVEIFEQESPDVVLIELDMISREDWFSFRDLQQIYQPILIFTSAEATFERARQAIDLHALDLMIKPFSTAKVKSAYQKAYRNLAAKSNSSEVFTRQNPEKELSYESLFLSQGTDTENYLLASMKAENTQTTHILYSFLAEYSFKDLQSVFALSDMVVLLFNNSCSNVIEQCQKAMRKWEEEFTEPLAVVIHKGKSSNRQKYIEIRKMLEFTYYQGYSQIVVFDHLQEWIHIDPFLDPPEQRAWIEMLGAFNLASIKNWLYEEFLILKDPYPDPGLVRIRLTSILAQIRRYMKTYKLDEQPTFEKEYRDIFHSILYDTVLYRTVQNLILFIQKIFQGARQNASNFKQDPIERAISYMEAHFSNSHLKLEDTAQYVERNPSYFSHLFSLKTGKAFREVLAEIRLREGKRLLAETTKPIKEIAYLVGYQNANYFSKSFKEAIGMSPREFRMKKQAQIE